MMKTKKRFTLLFGTAAVFLSTSSCRNDNPNSKTESVEIAQTELKDQGAVGFCWSYTAIALIEADFKKKTGKELNLSEEYLGYFKIRDSMAGMLSAYIDSKSDPTPFSAKLYSSMKVIATNEGSTVFDPSIDKPGEKKSQYFPNVSAFRLVEKYGVVPETVWAHKVTVGEKSRGAESGLTHELIKHYDFVTSKLDGGAKFDNQEIIKGIENFMVPKLFPKRPIESTFQFEGRKFTPKEFAKEFIGFKSEDFEVVVVKNVVDAKKQIGRIKRTLQEGYSVPLGFPVDDNRTVNDTFANNDKSVIVSPSYTPSTLAVNGGHAVLITDFVNIGGKEGKIENLEKEVKNDAMLLDYLVLKNSWSAVSVEDTIASNEKAKYITEEVNKLIAKNDEKEKLTNESHKATPKYVSPLFSQAKKTYLRKGKYLMNRNYFFDASATERGVNLVFRKSIP